MNEKKTLHSVTKEAVLAATEFSNMMAMYEAAADIVATRMRYHSGYYRLNGLRDPIDSIQTRVKSPESILGKMERLRIPFSMENMEREIHDIAGVRIICHFLTDVYLVRDLLEKQEGIRVVRVKDYIKNPKPGGYRSLHMILTVNIRLGENSEQVPVEVQIRTLAMNCWASCEHQLRYKKGRELTPENLARLQDCASRMIEMDEMFQSLADEILKD